MGVDAEACGLLSAALEAVGIAPDEYEIRVNNRNILNGLLTQLGLADKTSLLLRSLDKLAKIGRDKVIAEMIAEAGVTETQASEVIALTETAGTNTEILDQLDARFAGNPAALTGIANLRQMTGVFTATGIPEGTNRRRAKGWAGVMASPDPPAGPSPGG